MVLRTNANMRPLMEEVITKRSATMVQRLEKTELVVDGLLPKIARMDNNLNYLVRKIRYEDEAKARQTAMNGGGNPPSTNG